MDFAAIDFETANPDPLSACAVGVVPVRGGLVKEAFSSLIRPASPKFDTHFVAIHGITPEKVQDAPTFQEIWPEIERRCGAGLLVAHNTAFDVRVLTSCTVACGLPSLAGRYMCTVQLAKALLPGLPNHKLGTLTNLFGIPLDHHNPASDAMACAELAIRFVRLLGSVGIDGYCRDISSFGHSAERESALSGASLRISLEDLAVKVGAGSRDVSLVEPASLDGRFDGMRFVFTGDLAFLSRSEAEQIVERQGGKSTSSVSKKTDVLVVGDEVFDAFKRSGKTTGKLAKAIDLQDAANTIRIVDGSEFLDMIK